MQLQAYFSAPKMPAGQVPEPLCGQPSPWERMAKGSRRAHSPPQNASAWLGSKKIARKKKEPAATISAAAGTLRSSSRHQEPAKWAAQDSNL